MKYCKKCFANHTEDQKEALTREVLEETGLTVTNVSNISGSSLDTGDDVRIGKDNHPVLFYEVKVAEPNEIKTSGEHIGYSWVFPEDLNGIDLGAFGKTLKAFFANEEDLKLAYAGGIIALVPFEEISKQLEIPGGLPHNEMHITLAYIKYPWNSDPAKIVRELDTPKFQGVIDSFERFKDTNAERDAFVARIDILELDSWRTQLTGKLIDAGFSLSDYYTFKPHITLAYLEKDQLDPETPRKDIPIIFKSIEVWNGEEHQEIVVLNEHDESVLQKLQPPRPGLVPQSGDWNAPDRWIRPEDVQTMEKPKQFVSVAKIIGFSLKMTEKIHSALQIIPKNHLSGVTIKDIGKSQIIGKQRTIAQYKGNSLFVVDPKEIQRMNDVQLRELFSHELGHHVGELVRQGKIRVTGNKQSLYDVAQELRVYAGSYGIFVGGSKSNQLEEIWADVYEARINKKIRKLSPKADKVFLELGI